MEDCGSGTGKRKRPRTCVGCGEEFPRQKLIRIVRRPSGEVEIDKTGKAPGRGVYVCMNRDCVLKAQKRDLVSRGLKTTVPVEIYHRILADLSEKETVNEND